MKNYEDYLEDYVKAIFFGLLKGDDYRVRKEVYISMKWQEENNWNPWDKDAVVRLEALRSFDKRLYVAVLEGLDIFASYVERNEERNTEE